MPDQVDDLNMLDLKEKGNILFKMCDYDAAITIYSTAISHPKCANDLKATLLSNRAACYSKIGNFLKCKEDCGASIDLVPSNPKTWYRRALAHETTGNFNDAFKDVTMLLNMDANNKEGLTLARRLREALEKEKATDSEINRILSKMRTGERITDGMKMIISLSIDHKSHAFDFVRKGGMLWLNQYYQSKKHIFLPLSNMKHITEAYNRTDISTDPLDQISLSVRVLSSICNYQDCVKSIITIRCNDDNFNEQYLTESFIEAQINPILVDQYIFWENLCPIISFSRSKEIVEGLVAISIKILQSFPVVGNPPYILPNPSLSSPEEVEQDNSNEEVLIEVADVEDRVEELNDDGSRKNAKLKEGKPKLKPKRQSEPEDLEPNLYLRACPVKLYISSLGRAIQQCINSKTYEVLSVCLDTLTAFLSETPDYINNQKPVIDLRSEGMEERKERFRNERLHRYRSKKHAVWSVEAGILEYIVPGLEMSQAGERQKVAVTFARLCTALDDDEALKSVIKPYLAGADAVVTDGSAYSDSNRPPGMELCRQRAAVTSALFLSKPEVAAWALGLPGGVAQLLLLISAGDVVCQDISAEVLCLCSSTENGASLLAAVVSSGALHALLRSSVAATRAAAASTLTKLSLKAKAIKDDNDDELTTTLNVVLDVIRDAVEKNRNLKGDTSSNNGTSKKGDKPTLVSFSTVDLDTDTSTKPPLAARGLSTSTERAIEVVASLAARTAIKEELVHGSYRMSAAVTTIIALANDAARMSNTACFGLAHILCSLTVTNYELQLAALAEKEMTPEQYKQLKDLSRVQTKDEAGQDISEPEEPEDTDTDQLRNIRIRKLVSYDIIPAIIKLMNDSESLKAKEVAARTLRQICVEASARGPVVQQGGLSACYKLVEDEVNDKLARLEAAHVIAKTLVTTNPAALSDHVRLGAIKPLLYACRHVDATNLLQFEACLSLTNLVSFGVKEQEKLVVEKGVSAVHYLMFSDHYSVRRAATEVLCNMSTSEALLAIMRIPERLRLWLSLMDDLDNEDNHEAEATSRAASGTLAMAASDDKVCEAMMKEKCVEIFVRVLSMCNNDINHRVLVILQNMLEMQNKKDIALQFMEAGIISIFSDLLKTLDTSDVVRALVEEVAVSLSKIVT